MGKNWINDIEDIAYFFESNKNTTLTNNIDGTINIIHFNKNIEVINNFNNSISKNFDITPLNISKII